MRHSLFKYFSQTEHAAHFLEGKIFFRSLQYFVDYEDGEVRGDTNEGTHVYRPEKGLEINNLSQGNKQLLLNKEFRSSVKKGDIFIFCLSMAYSDQLSKEFESVACVEIRDKRKFLQSIRTTLENQGEQVWTGRVLYRDPSHAPNHLWALPERICLTKAPKFSRQNEYRIAFGRPEVFVPNNVELTISDLTHKPMKKLGFTENFTIEIGGISGICTVHSSVGTVR
jgi:hypothetical protein